MVNVVAYALEMILIRAGVLDLSGSPLSLQPKAVVESFQIWRLFTYPLIHDPGGVGHLAWNMLYLWIFGAPLENLHGSRTVLRAYAAGALVGSLFTLVVGSIYLVASSVPWLGGVLFGIYAGLYIGATGGILGIAFCFAAVQYHSTLNMIFLGAVSGRVFMLILVILEVLSLLSLGGAQWTLHLGGAVTGAGLGFGWWQVGTLRSLWRRRQLEAKRRDTERRLSKLQVLDGGRGQRGNRPEDWVN
jgi:membrane associated rhomboid family serine protease